MEHPELRDPMDPQDQQDYPDHVDPPDWMDNQDLMEQMEKLVMLEHQENQDPQDFKAHQVAGDLLDLKVAVEQKVNEEDQGKQDRQESQENQDHRDQMAVWETEASLVIPDLKEKLDQGASLDPSEIPDPQVVTDQLDHQDPLVTTD